MVEFEEKDLNKEKNLEDLPSLFLTKDPHIFIWEMNMFLNYGIT